MNSAANPSFPLSVGLPTTWWQWLLCLAGLLITLVAIRFTFSLDLNAWAKDRNEKQISRIQNACTHMHIDHVGEGQYRVQPTFVSPPGTVQYFCKRCQLASWNPDEEYPRRGEYYVAHIDEYLAAEKAFGKLLKKSGYSN